MNVCYIQAIATWVDTKLIKLHTTLSVFLTAICVQKIVSSGVFPAQNLEWRWESEESIMFFYSSVSSLAPSNCIEEGWGRVRDHVRLVSCGHANSVII